MLIHVSQTDICMQIKRILLFSTGHDTDKDIMPPLTS